MILAIIVNDKELMFEESETYPHQLYSTQKIDRVYKEFFKNWYDKFITSGMSSTLHKRNIPFVSKENYGMIIGCFPCSIGEKIGLSYDFKKIIGTAKIRCECCGAFYNEEICPYCGNIEI